MSRSAAQGRACSDSRRCGTAQVAYNLGTLANGSMATVNIRVKPTTAGILETVASVSSSTPDPRLNDNNTALVRSTASSVTPPVQCKVLLPLVLRN